MSAKNDNVTLKLDGVVPFPDFATAISELNELLKSLCSEITGSAATVQWKVVELSASSAATTIQGTSDDPKDVPSILTAYSTVGQALEDNSEIPYSEEIRRHARSIASLVNGEITAIHFGTPRALHIVRKPPKREEKPVTVDAFGTIEGRIRTLSDRQSLKFTLYDNLFDAPVICYLSLDNADEAARLWRKRVVVEGLIRRNPKTGIPMQIRKIRAISELPSSNPGSYREARGALRNIANS
ncbi:MAG: hypothetical protein OXM03_01630 [Chloroflexota bacterium]|nr:hypothetical protein [Chloroflexota bacterium]MDE2839307.1 hypothetical protein [Chloroflexota bacterium]MDE2931339.1 hypothetical protein [Chloroflexota bacterium]